MRQKKSLKIFLFRITLFFFLLIFIFILIYLINLSLEIKKIEVVGKTYENLTGLAELNMQNLLFLKTATVGKKLVQQNPQIEKVTIQKNYPNKITIYVQTYQPIADLQTSPGFFVLGNDGRIIAKIKKNPPALPLIHYYQQFYYYQNNAGDYISYPDLKAAIFFLNKLNTLNVRVDTIDIQDIDMLVFNLNSKKIIFTSIADLNREAYDLETIITRFKMEAVDFKTLDLRFDKPVVQF